MKLKYLTVIILFITACGKKPEKVVTVAPPPKVDTIWLKSMLQLELVKPDYRYCADPATCLWKFDGDTYLRKSRIEMGPKGEIEKAQVYKPTGEFIHYEKGSLLADPMLLEMESWRPKMFMIKEQQGLVYPELPSGGEWIQKGDSVLYRNKPTLFVFVVQP
ncbi:hypothetical protein LX64_04301 [Chitinophaga skermanii]|uniref:Uncharacterized protein n=1 Tax=Chitinophaga skermanii TaxID=331697 RepID=A0A327Q5M5_9BACT|nr:hypothetical protein [Chitinophaga skermanii]RAI99748.1 hypothetical protein LX64_04301 [Chitinophaga skermanii]